MADAFYIYSRSDWGAAPPSGGEPALALPVTDVFLHHEAGPLSPATLTVAEEIAKMRSLQAECMAKGYNDFPYGCAVFGSGRAYEGRDLGFVCGGMTAQEAATLDHNQNSIAIVWPGNFMIQFPTAEQMCSTATVIQIAQLAGNVAAVLNLKGHRDTAFSTACPGDHAEAVLPQLRSLVAQPPPVPKEIEDVICVPQPNRTDSHGDAGYAQFVPASALFPNGAAILKADADVDHSVLSGTTRYWTPPPIVAGRKWVSMFGTTDGKRLVLVDDQGATTRDPQGTWV